VTLLLVQAAVVCAILLVDLLQEPGVVPVVIPGVALLQEPGVVPEVVIPGEIPVPVVVLQVAEIVLQAVVIAVPALELLCHTDCKSLLLRLGCRNLDNTS